MLSLSSLLFRCIAFFEMLFFTFFFFLTAYVESIEGLSVLLHCVEIQSKQASSDIVPFQVYHDLISFQDDCAAFFTNLNVALGCGFLVFSSWFHSQSLSITMIEESPLNL